MLSVDSVGEMGKAGLLLEPQSLPDKWPAASSRWLVWFVWFGWFHVAGGEQEAGATFSF